MPLVRDPKPRRRRRKLSRKGAKFIASFEGFRSDPYQDTGGVWTIGYGHTRGVGPGTKPLKSQRQGRRILRKDAAPLADLVRRVAHFPLEQHQLDMMISAGFNMGPGVFDPGRSLGDALRRGTKKDVAEALQLYVHDISGNRLAGLERRRKAEARVFLRGYRKRGR